MCYWLQVSASGFFDWRRRPASATVRCRTELAGLIEDAFRASDETYGYRRIHAQLNRWGVACGLELVRGIMRELGLQPCQPRPWRLGQGLHCRLPDGQGRVGGSAVEPGAGLLVGPALA